MTRFEAVNFLLKQPYMLGKMVGFSDLLPLHNKWIRQMILSKTDKTLQAHRASYKTTCVSLAISIIMILEPRKRILFVRKTDPDVREVLRQVQKILSDDHTRYFVKCIYGADLRLTVSSYVAVSTNLSQDVKGAPQLQGIGTASSLTGKHFDYIFTDDIVNVDDRVSKAERDRTKIIYQELQNIKNRGGRIFNTGTPWHKDDCFTLMPPPERWDCYSTGMMTPEQIEAIKEKMTPSLFAANYELKHISDDSVIFTSPKTGADPALVEQGDAHIDAAYGGDDYTALTICRKGRMIKGYEYNGAPVYDDRLCYFIYGRLWHKHIDDVEDEIIAIRQKFAAGRIYCEDNGDKGYLAKSLRKKGERVVTYHESMNKHIKITSYLKAEWNNVYFVEGTDKEYIDQICDYNENAEHDDAPDSAACMIRQLWNKGEKKEYQSIFMA